MASGTPADSVEVLGVVPILIGSVGFLKPSEAERVLAFECPTKVAEFAVLTVSGKLRMTTRF